MKAAEVKWSTGSESRTTYRQARSGIWICASKRATKVGNSSRPVPDNAICHLANAWVKLSQFGFPLKTNEVTRAHFAGMAKIDTSGASAGLAKVAENDPEVMKRIAAASPSWNSMLRTTCVATMIEGGDAHNALPQLAAANVNCRVQPDGPLQYEIATLKNVISRRSSSHL